MKSLNRAWLGAGLLALGSSVLPIASAAVTSPEFLFAAVYKSIDHEQIGTADPVLSSGLPYSMGVSLAASSGTSITGATISGPLLGVTDLTAPDTGDTEWQYHEQRFLTQAALDAAHPNTNSPETKYTLTVNTASTGSPSFALSLQGNSYPVAPKVTNYTTLPTANLAQDVVVEFTASGNAGNYVQVQLSDQNHSTFWSTPMFGQPNALTGATTSVTIPGGTVDPTNFFYLELMEAVSVDSNYTYNGVPVVAAYASSTSVAVPEPTSLGLIGVGATLLMKRRRA